MTPFAHRIACAVAALATTLAASAQDAYPAKPIKLVVPFATGSGIDQLARHYAEVLRTQMNQSVVVVDNDLKLTFTAVPEDSRCPRFTDCIQEGQVRINFSVAIGGKSQVVEFVRKPSDKGNTTVAVDKFKIQLYGVEPYPESGKKINLADYVARIAVRKVG